MYVVFRIVYFEWPQPFRPIKYPSNNLCSIDWNFSYFFVFMAIQDTTTINAIILVVNQLATFVIQLVNTWPLAIDNRQKDKGE